LIFIKELTCPIAVRANLNGISAGKDASIHAGSASIRRFLVKTMMRLALAAAALAATLCFDVPASRAHGDGPWCAVVSIGKGGLQTDCHYRSIEECIPYVIAGNRGFCNHNPRWNGLQASKVHRKRHARRN
jgi:hypothetical protein